MDQSHLMHLVTLGRAGTHAHGVWEKDRHFLRDASSLTWLSCQLQSRALNTQLLCQLIPRHQHTMGMTGWTVSEAEGHKHSATLQASGETDKQAPIFVPAKGTPSLN